MSRLTLLCLFSTDPAPVPPAEASAASTECAGPTCQMEAKTCPWSEDAGLRWNGADGTVYTVHPDDLHL